MTTEPPSSPKNRRRRGCCGCILLLGVLTIGLIVTVLAGPWVLRQLGFYGPSAEELYSGAPNRQAAIQIEEAFAERNISGVDVLVLPITGSEGHIAVLTIEDAPAAGGIQTEAEAEIFLRETMEALVTSSRESGAPLDQVAVDLRGSEGDPLITIAADAATVEAYAAGEITRAEFVNSVGVDISNLVDALRAEGLLEGE